MLEAEVEANNTQLQQKDGQTQRDAELQERVAQINRQQRELQTLRVREWIFYCTCALYNNNDSSHALLVRKTK